MNNRKYDDTATKIIKDGSKLHTLHSQDSTATVEHIKQLRHINGGKTEYGYHAAKLPMTALMEWAQEDCGDHLAYLQGKHNRNPELAKKLAARMNSNEFQDFRIWNGTVAASDMLKEGNKYGKPRSS